MAAMDHPQVSEEALEEASEAASAVESEELEAASAWVHHKVKGPVVDREVELADINIEQQRLIINNLIC